ncbi:MAG: quinone-dependent dihydroorotate dehydrogenase [Firmicutes bacterium]|nr:quinone-dependent dihydroorotate dehydrogenase [Bacillota bacterium]
MSIYDAIFPVLQTLDAERAHRLGIALLRAASQSALALAALRRRYEPLPGSVAVETMGLRFPSCVGVAAGLDKDGEAIPALAALGFGFVEVGTVTPLPQPGNPRPRLWRLPAHRALINRMGFNSKGAEAVARSLARSRTLVPVPVGVNIGKNRNTPLERAAEDYAAAMRALGPWADFAVVNVSSPNTPGLRRLQDATALAGVLDAVIGAARPVRSGGGRDGGPLPVLVKVSPDLSASDLDALLDVCLKRRVAGLIATNTTVSRAGVHGPAARRPGGLSGGPLFQRSNQVGAAIYRRTRGRLPVIGVGGVMSADDAYTKIKAGATLVQVYTGFVYGGPGFAARLARGLADRLARDGFNRVANAVGVEAARWPEPDERPGVPVTPGSVALGSG